LNNPSSLYGRIVLLTVCLTFFIVTLGAFVRLSEAGLGCPDWPGCYGHVGVPDEHHEINAANAAYPERPVESAKAWKEMIHRYFASSLGLLLIGLAVSAWLIHKKNPAQQVFLPTLMVPLVMLQGAFGAWTVTLKVHPVFVTGHLIFGMTTLSLVWLMWLKQLFPSPSLKKIQPRNQYIRRLAGAALIVVVLQIALGGWVSTNYAAVQCGDFPTCQGELLPNLDFKKAFNIFLPIGPDYQGGLLDNVGRVTIHMTHRFGALITFIVISLLGCLCLKEKNTAVKRTTIFMFFFLVAQVSLGISNVVFGLPLAIAVAHNGVAALLLLSVIALNYFLTLVKE